MLPKHPKPFFTAIQQLLCLGWVSQALAGQVPLVWNATTTHTDGTPGTDLRCIISTTGKEARGLLQDY